MDTQSTNLRTGGGAVIAGDVNAGTFIGRDQIITEEAAYNVEGLPNPYRGLRPYTYDDRDLFAGRGHVIEEAVLKLTVGAKRVLLFVTGASGSGKSSLTQAGIVPALSKHYAEYGETLLHVVFRPSSDALAGLRDALSKLGIEGLSGHRDPQTVVVIVIDQFEECFTQAKPASRDQLFGLLTSLSPFDQCRMHILVTMRSDYLNELFQVEALWNIARQDAIELRAMSLDELSEAIQRPLQVMRPQGDKRFEQELVERLAQDASGNATYLPLLQVTLSELWKKGRLTLANYNKLTDAIKQRAETVYTYSDFDNPNPFNERSASDRDTILSIFLDLVEVSLDDDARRDVRRRRLKSDLVKKDTTRRTPLIEELTRARLLSISNDGGVDAVDIIHESLINNWDRLRREITEQRRQLQRRASFEQALRQWQSNDCTDGYLLSDLRLAEAQELERANDIALQDEYAKTFLKRSIAREQTEQQRELRLKRQSITTLRILVGVLAALLLVSIVVIARPYVLSFMARSDTRNFERGTVQITLDDQSVLIETVGPVAVEIYEVSNGQYRLCVDTGACEPPLDADSFNDASQSSYPVVFVTENQAEQYCRWIGRRIPSAAEWMHIALGGTGRPWPWGTQTPSDVRANVYNANPGLMPVTFAGGISKEGVYNLVGNVWEWTSTSADNDERVRLTLGGSWANAMDAITTTFASEKSLPGSTIGFRCVVSR